MIERTYPADFLREITIVDTPGTNAIIRRHEQLTRRFVPRADLVLFVTSADRPFTESERAFLETIREWGKKIVIILNKIDLLGSQRRPRRVSYTSSRKMRRRSWVRSRRSSRWLRLASPSKAGATATFAEREALLKASRFDEIERYIFDTLDEAGPDPAQALNPLGVAERLLDKYRRCGRSKAGRAGRRLQDHREHRESARDLRLRYAPRVHRQARRDRDIIYNLKERGDAFFDETFRDQHLGLIQRRTRARRLRARGGGRQRRPASTGGQALIDLDGGPRPAAVAGRAGLPEPPAPGAAERGLIGQVGGTFEYNRAELLQSVARTAREWWRATTGSARRKLAEEMRGAVAQTAVAGVGALSLGTLIVALVGTVAADVTGMPAAMMLGGLGLFLIPAKQRQAQRQFHDRIAELRAQLQASMTSQFDAELARSLDPARRHRALHALRPRRARQGQPAPRHPRRPARRDRHQLRGQIDHLAGAG